MRQQVLTNLQQKFTELNEAIFDDLLNFWLGYQKINNRAKLSKELWQRFEQFALSLNEEELINLVFWVVEK